ncbi:6-methylsalicylic acid decarboxylase atA [Pseudocercospora fuligena]|uniref:6-methylsalicylic acid decarboxylase atA n=1 Tax=Pseudocercospora fuligena TaxID=685502 RepID=A0A8H6RDT5_9PEZI|nr:6-methylsalicylic acid decarboxylase atA [Pseudocercospora fuligena]
MAATGSKQDLDVAVVGGGFAGLCLAIGLIKHNIPVTVYESAHHFGEIGAGVSLGSSAQRAMIGIDPRIAQGFENVATYNDWDSMKDVYFTFRFGEGQDAGKDFAHLRHEGRSGGVHRAHFLDELIKLVPEGVAKFGKRVVDVQQLADGKVNLSIHSKIGEYILGKDDPAAQAVFSGKYCHRGLIPMDKAIEAIGEERAVNSQFYLGHNSHMLSLPISKGKIFNVVAFSSCDTWDQEKWVVPSEVKDIHEDFKHFGEPVQTIINMMEHTDIWALFNHLPARTYVKGNVTIIGDAAHATTPHQGSGAGMAIEDSYVLSELMGRVQEPRDIQKAFEAYEETRKGRTLNLVETSRQAGMIWEMQDPGTAGDAKKIAANAAERWKWIWDEDLESEIKRGLAVMGKA